ncbi:hypothetical protein [Amycolatopsis silviterrae]|uniref:PH domain-containing protein n=1 Tax=Amycolatopsis silviterrae TaxID=1656914 RepID=A0ABW5HE25_9PSEU
MTQPIGQDADGTCACSDRDERSLPQKEKANSGLPAGADTAASVRVNRRWPPYPRFDAEFVSTLVDRLDLSGGVRKELVDGHRRCSRRRWLFATAEVMFVVMYAAFALLTMSAAGFILSGVASPAAKIFIAYGGLVVALVLLPAVFFRVIWWDRSAARQRAIRACGLLLRHVRIDEHRTSWPQPGTWVLARLGVMAKSAFTMARGGRLTWTVPPAVSDRATSVALPLLDVALPDDIDLPGSAAYRQAIAEFAADAAYLLLAGRPDLLPRLRQRYSHRLRPRAADLTDRDERYVDPLRGRTPWDVAKDHILPIVAVLVSLVAILRK